MNKINESVFQKPRAQDDKGLEEEAKSLLVKILDNGKAVILGTEYFNGQLLDSSVAPAVLIHGDEGAGVIHSRLAGSGIDILITGPKTGSGQRILVLNDGSTGLVFRNVLLRRFLSRGA
ncbi:uncharacterized protein N7515_009970 [Penicillium bovifimosum]|uniref:Uncharacterized protein n=1 Tax=Penicillium bovifimosum TaxID=126998 RepID=A0A9W9GIZ2_9EURO|nr:uncharacterized protein N7515_009970 [Penicillium bovifimosum]KAJ5120582.1 hypothetical protein N7515_009970 [Penicillium bovifimosum]